jgi:hypothetical protein
MKVSCAGNCSSKEAALNLQTITSFYSVAKRRGTCTRTVDPLLGGGAANFLDLISCRLVNSAHNAHWPGSNLKAVVKVVGFRLKPFFVTISAN